MAVPWPTLRARIVGRWRALVLCWCRKAGYVPVPADDLQACRAHLLAARAYLGRSGHLNDGRCITRRVRRRLDYWLTRTLDLLEE
ncbi:MAG: hypothetical protein K6T59_11575 [Bryobacteraceae bacterium]|nr:hypothetical protein [Bryobacteraceae bacterium]